MFKKHKVLPHPRRDSLPAAWVQDVKLSTPRQYGLEVDKLLSRSTGQDVPSRTSSRRTAGAPEPPPTPPAHSRKSSSSRSVNPTSPVYVASPLQSSEQVQSQAPATPTNQQSPPTPNLTPDRTPPGLASRLTRPRPAIGDRIPSRPAPESRTESFKTAPENPYSSGDDEDKSTLRPILPSAKTSQDTVRQADGEKKTAPRAVGLGLGLESSPGGDLTPRTAKEFNVFDGEWGERGGGSPSEVEEEWDFNLGRNVVVKKRRPNGVATNGATTNRTPLAYKDEVVEDLTVTPTNATKALRSIALQESPVVYPARRVVSDRVPAQAAPSNSESSFSTDYRRSSMMSTKSTASTVVEAILVETAPQRRKTLRHVRKQTALRDSRSDLSPASSAPTSVSAYVESVPRRRLSPKVEEVPRESYASNATFNSISSRKARREIRKNGGIPVVIVPERRSSIKSNSKEPSLRSTSSRRSKRSQSLSSVPPSQVNRSKENVPIFERPVRRGRAASESDGSCPGDQRTMDFPPVIPARSSSLSAPTSRNASRTGSLTADSLKAHNAFQAQQPQHVLQGVHRMLEELHTSGPRRNDSNGRSQKATHREVPKTPPTAHNETFQPTVLVRRATSIESKKSGDALQSRSYQDSHDTHEDQEHRLHVDRYGDPFFGKRLSVQNTPFSQASMETTGTSHAEVSEAMAVNIYPHQNKSVLMVDHSTRPSESSSLERKKSLEPETPTPKAFDAIEGNIPVTPPQAFSMDDIDSPLRNPRAPPEPPAVAPVLPPAIKFIPATPSGLTPATEKERMLGNYYEATGEKPKRRPSLLQRTLSRRRYSEYGPSPVRPVGLLARTFSLSRASRKEADDWDIENGKRPALKRYPTADDRPADENRLHPFWRPAYEDDTGSETDGEDWDHESSGSRTYRYPPIDNRPGAGAPRRSLSARVKKTFSILPVRDDYSESFDPVDRRTIRRTPSGNLRVMKFRRSMESLPRIPLNDGRPYTAPDQGNNRYSRQFRFWRSPRASSDSVKRSGSGRGFLPALGNRINFPRRLSERRRERRNQELRRMISGPREVRDGVGDVIRRNSYREAYREAYAQQHI